MRSRQNVHRWVLAEAFTAARFGVVGVAATAVHMSIAWLLIVGAEVRPMGANLVAFLCAFSVSFSGQYFWTFGARGDRRRAIRRFFLVSALAFLLNNVVLAGLLKAGTLAPIWAVIFAACVIPAITYTSSRLWAFR